MKSIRRRSSQQILARIVQLEAECKAIKESLFYHHGQFIVAAEMFVAEAACHEAASKWNHSIKWPASKPSEKTSRHDKMTPAQLRSVRDGSVHGDYTT